MSNSQLTSNERLLGALREAKSQLEAAKSRNNEPIAIVGMSCRFPGADSPQAFWDLLRDGRDMIRDIPEARWNADAYYNPVPGTPGKMYVQEGGFIDNVDQFDPRFFGIAPREANSLDPQHRLLLEVGWEALEQAGQACSELQNSQTGVFVGLMGRDYSKFEENAQQIHTYTATGNGFCFASGRLSHVLGLQGPNMVVDTACSASLVAIHLACQSLRLGECNLALAGGVNLMLAPEVTIAMSQMQALAPDGRCKTFDAAADGTSRGEGCGIIILKRLADAVKERDNILAVVRGSAINHDGPGSGLTVPNKLAQEKLIRTALNNAKVEADDVMYIDAHGTGTTLGDPIELRALADGFDVKKREQPLWVGSVKTNIGHLEPAAGISGVIKVILAMQHNQIPPHLHFQQPNPYFDWDRLPLQIPTEPTPWPEGVKIAGVSSFGMGGTNAHVILQQAPEIEPVAAETKRPLELLTLSAKNDAALKDLVKLYHDHITEQSDDDLADICYTANIGRSHFAHRLSVVGESLEQMHAQLGDLVEDHPTTTRPEEDYSDGHLEDQPPGIAFLFTGQGSQYAGMGQQLYATQPTFCQAIDRCDALLRSELDKSLIDILYNTETDQTELVHQTVYTQPLLFAVEYALSELWRSWGIVPDTVMGHSVGEYVAACVAGVFSLEDGLSLMAARGRLMGALANDGAMVSVMADEAMVQSVIEPYTQQVSIAAVNGPQSVVISGKAEQVHAIVAKLEAEGIKTRQLTVSHAFHSPLMDQMLDEFKLAAQQVRYAEPKIALISNVTGKLATETITTPEYWVQHVRNSVRFADSIQTLASLGGNVFIEIGPKPTLLGMGRECLPANKGMWLPSLRQGKPDWQQMLESLGALYARGIGIDWQGFYQDDVRRKVVLPTYPFQRQRYWVDLPEKQVAQSHSDSQAKSAVVQLLEQGDTAQLRQQLRKTGELNADEEKVMLKLLDLLVQQHQEQSETGSDAVSDYYSATARLHSEAAQEQYVAGQPIKEPFLSFGIFPKIAPEFSWIQAMTRLPEHREQTSLMHQAQEELRRLLFAEVDFASCHAALDFGCGYGSDLMVLAQKYPHLSLSGYTISSDQASIGNKKVATYGLQEQVQVFNRDSTKVPFPHECGLIYGIEVACHIKDKAALFANVSEHLRENGMLVLADFISNDEFPIEYNKISSYLATQHDWVQLFSQHNLKLISHIDVSPEIANFFEVSDVDAHVAQLPQGEAYDITRAGIQSHEQLRKLLRKGLVSYVLLTAQKQDELSTEELLRWNQNALNSLASYTESAPSQWLYEVQWQPECQDPALQDDVAESTQGQRWLILADADGTGKAVAEALSARGAQPILVFAGTDYEQVNANTFTIDPNSPSDYLRLLEAIPNAYGVDAYGVDDQSADGYGVIHLWSFDHPGLNNAGLNNAGLNNAGLNHASHATASDLEAAYQSSCASTLQLLHALHKTDTHPSSLWLVTQSAQAVVSRDRVEGLTHSTLWGMGKVIGVEHPELNCVLLDLDANALVDDRVGALCSELNRRTAPGEASETQIAWRDGTRYVARLRRYEAYDETVDDETANNETANSEIANSEIANNETANSEMAEAQTIAVRDNGTYLITGGLGGLGLLVAHWLAEQGAKHLVLMGRSQPKPAVQSQLDQLRKLGTAVTIASADVTDKAQVAEVIANIDNAQPLRGIIHAAGVSDSETLLQQEWQRFDKILKPKIRGTWNLHTLTAECDLDFFVLFSSAATLLGGMRQASYTAANAFLDAFAYYRRGQGLPAMSIDWAFWGEVGMADRAFEQEMSAVTALGYRIISPERGIHIFAHLLSQPVTQIGVIPINWAKFLDMWQMPTRFLEKFDSLDPLAMYDEDAGSSFRQELEPLPVEERRDLLQGHLRAAITKVLRLHSSDEINPRQGLMDMGFDSLMAIELRNHLANSLAHQLPATLLFDYPTLNALTAYLEQELFDSASTESETLEMTTIDDDSLQSRTPPAQTDASITELSDDEAASLLMDRLDKIGV